MTLDDQSPENSCVVWKKSMGISKKWICLRSSKKMVVKIVYPGGHKEVHDMPILASEVMQRNPKCVVAYPNVFQQPWAIVEADNILSLGHKFYAVPISTIRKLQRHSLKNSPSPLLQNTRSSAHRVDKRENNNNKKGKICCACSWVSAGKRDDSCLLSLINGFKVKNANGGDHSSSARTGSSSSSSVSFGYSDNKGPHMGSCNRSFTASDHWQPGLESIIEE